MRNERRDVKIPAGRNRAAGATVATRLGPSVEGNRLAHLQFSNADARREPNGGGGNMNAHEAAIVIGRPHPVVRVDFSGPWRTNQPLALSGLNSKTTLVAPGGRSSLCVAFRGSRI